MKFIADFHIHSHFSMATSKLLVPEYLDLWARKKGISVVGTGDFTHPGWIAKLKEKLEPEGTGLFKLKPEYKINPEKYCSKEPRFILTAEISNIYKKNGKVRKLHHLIFAPDFDVVDRVISKLQNMDFNITSDGRPILGFDSKNLLDLLLNISSDIFFVPAHIWTPWFAVLGSKSGFDSIEECFEDLSSHIYAVETGLSTDPPLNWMCGFLDKYTLISNSDAHSPEKLGRNANILNVTYSYHDIINAMKTGEGFIGTIDMFPQEGKYHYDGHRRCKVCLSPVETLMNKGKCPVCGKMLTIGVTNRIAQLADRNNILERPNKKDFYSIIPLKEILAEIYKVSPGTKTVEKAYENLIDKAGSEFNVLLNDDMDKIKNYSGSLLTEAIQRMRNGQVKIKEGYDGEFGHITVFDKNEIDNHGFGNGLFNGFEIIKPTKRKLLNFDLSEFRRLSEINKKDTKGHENNTKKEKTKQNSDGLYGLNQQQNGVVLHQSGPALVIAGPGTGKTRVLAYRIKYLIENEKIGEDEILAITFSNKASIEIKQRIKSILNKEKTGVHVYTFHALGLEVLKQEINQQLQIIDNDDKLWILKNKTNINKRRIKTIAKQISEFKQALNRQYDEDFDEIFSNYQNYLNDNNLIEIDDLIYKTVLLFDEKYEIKKKWAQKFKYIHIDEYQDINPIQYRFLTQINEPELNNLMAIGDPNQAIYGFRGSDVGLIKKFMHDYENVASYFLNKSYRCSDKILQASQDVVERGEHNEALLGIEKGVKINIVKNATDRSEAEFIARSIEKIVGGLRFYSLDSNVSDSNDGDERTGLADIAVLCRTSLQFDAIIKAFNDHSIPYNRVGERPFFKTGKIRMLVDFLQLLRDSENRFFIERYNYPDLKHDELISLAEKIKPFSSEKAIIYIIENYFSEIKTEKHNEFKRLLNISNQYFNLDAFLAFTRIGGESEDYNKNIESVSLMTLHASKGLEFDCVFIPGCENRIIPFSLFPKLKSDKNEERRLLYVGMTRAKRLLYLTHAGQRSIKGTIKKFGRSKFIDKIEKQLIELKSTTESKQNQSVYEQKKLF